LDLRAAWAGGVRGGTIDPAGRYAAVATGGRTLSLLAIASGTEAGRADLPDAISVLAFSRAGARLAVAARDRAIPIFAVPELAPLRQLRLVEPATATAGAPGQPWGLAFTPDGR